GNKGIAVGLNNIQLVEKGEPLGGASAAEDDFDELDTDDEDFL
ncbi:ssDNA-binding protein, partial [Staphylococcus aureus]